MALDGRLQFLTLRGGDLADNFLVRLALPEDMHLRIMFGAYSSRGAPFQWEWRKSHERAPGNPETP